MFLCFSLAYGECLLCREWMKPEISVSCPLVHLVQQKNLSWDVAGRERISTVVYHSWEKEKQLQLWKETTLLDDKQRAHAGSLQCISAKQKGFSWHVQPEQILLQGVKFNLTVLHTQLWYRWVIKHSEPPSSKAEECKGQMGTEV